MSTTIRYNKTVENVFYLTKQFTFCHQWLPLMQFHIHKPSLIFETQRIFFYETSEISITPLIPPKNKSWLVYMNRFNFICIFDMLWKWTIATMKCLICLAYFICSMCACWSMFICEKKLNLFITSFFK